MKHKKDTRRELRRRAFQAIASIEFGQEPLEAARFAYVYDKEEDEQVEIPLFLLQLVTETSQHLAELDQQISQKLKTGWTLDRLTVMDKSLMRLGLSEILYIEETPDKVAVNEIIDIAKEFTDAQSVKFINGVLTQFVTEA